MAKKLEKVTFKFIDALHDCEQAHAYVFEDGTFCFHCPFMDLQGKPERYGLPPNLEPYKPIPEGYFLNLAMCHCGMCRYAYDILFEQRKGFVPKLSPYDVEYKFWNPEMDKEHRQVIRVEMVENAVRELERIKRFLKASIKEEKIVHKNN